jgi:uncharacterized protein (TIGR00270 family)
MCGANKKLYVTMVEGTEMQLCDACKVYGEVKRSIPTTKEQKFIKKRQKTYEHKKQVTRDTVEVITENYGVRIKNAREQRKIKQEKFAQQMGLKASQLHSFESGHREPSLDTARKLERALSITLIEHYTEEHKETTKTYDGPVTIGDLLKK